MTAPSTRSASWPVALVLVVATFVIPVVTFREVDLGVEVFSRFATVGLTAVVLILSRVGQWPLLVPLLVASAVGARISNGIELAPAVAGGSGHVAAALLATLIIVRWRVHEDGVATLERQGDVVRLLLASVTAGLLAALTEGYLITDGAGLLSPEAVAVFAGRAASVLVVVPLALTLHVRRSGRLDELVLQTSLLSLVTVLTFSPGQDLPLPFVTLPLLVWGALRFDVRTVSLQLLAFSCFVAVATAQGHGVFGAARVQAYFGRDGAATLSQLFLLAAALVTLPLVVAITQRTQLLAAISTEEERFRRHFTESLIGGVFLRADGEELVIEDVNEAGTRILAASSEELRDRRLDTVLETLEPDLPLTPTSLHDAGTGWRGCATVRARAGSRVELAVAALSPGSTVRTFSAQLLDVTSEHEARRRLETAQSLTTATLDSAACVIVVTDTNGTIVRVNGATSGITGYADSELVGQPVWHTSIAPMERADVEALFVSPHRSGVPLVRERRGTTKDGEALRLVWSSNVVIDEVGVPSYAVLTGIDVTAERASTDLVAHLMQATLATALIGIDTVGRITVFNAGAEHLLGYAAGEIVGQPFAQFLDPAQLLERTGAATVGEALLSLVATLRKTRESSARDWTWISREGSPITVSTTLSLTDDELTDRVGVLCVGRDVTEQREAQEALVMALQTERRAVERLRALDHAKDEFVSTVSHELRTPVSSIVGYTEMLKDGTVVAADPDQVPLLDTIARNGERLIVICNDLLLLSGLDTGSVSWARDRVDLAESLAAAVDSVRPMLLGRDLTLTIDGPEAAVEVIGDRAQLEGVVTNLLSNAVKFTEDGGTVGVRLVAEGSQAVLTVHDTGLGIPEDEHQAVFEKFFRTAVAQKRAIPGTGLGLSIVAAIVDAHHGTIGVDSAPAQGAVFTVHLPLAP